MRIARRRNLYTCDGFKDTRICNQQCSSEMSVIKSQTNRSYYIETNRRISQHPSSSTSPKPFLSKMPSVSSTNSSKMTFALVTLSFCVCVVLGGYPPSSYYPVKKYPYLPAPPGETPSCAKHGSTFCEKIETYPTEVVSYLLYKYGNMYQQFLKSESDRDFFLISQTYGPAPYEGGYSSPHDKHYHQNHHYNNNQGGYSNNNNNQGGYSNNYNNYNNHSSASGGYPNSYYRSNDNNNRYQREYGGYGGGGGNGNNNGGGGYQFAAAMPPMVQSMWWNHRDTVTNRPAFPHVQQHRGGYRKKRQASGDGQLCPTRSNFIAPQAAMNNEGNWMYVVNLDDPRYLQMVRAEFCQNGDGSACNGVCNVGPGVRASCRQKYVQKRLVALDGSGESFRNDVFWFAHCCVCQIQ